MNKRFLVLFLFCILNIIMSGCNLGSKELNTGENMTYHKEVVKNGEIMRSIITYQSSGYQLKDHSYNVVSNTGSAGSRGLEHIHEIDSNNEFFIAHTVDLINEIRRKNGLLPLTVDMALQKAAQFKSVDMAKFQYLSHHSQTYGSPFQMLKNFGINYTLVTENIAQDQRSPNEAVNAWMGGLIDRQNILNPEITHIGMGYVTAGDYWTLLLIQK